MAPIDISELITKFQVINYGGKIAFFIIIIITFFVFVFVYEEYPDTFKPYIPIIIGGVICVTLGTWRNKTLDNIAISFCQTIEDNTGEYMDYWIEEEETLNEIKDLLKKSSFTFDPYGDVVKIVIVVDKQMYIERY